MSRLRTWIVSAIATAVALFVTPPLDAQRTEGRNLSIAYESGGPTRNGYMDAQVQIVYYFGTCAGNVAFLASYNPTPHMLVGNHRYWVDGRQVEVPPHIAPPRISSPTITGTVRGNGIARDINYVHASSSSPGCLTNDLSIGPTSQFWPAGTPEDRRLALLNGFGLDQRGKLPPLRNAEVENHFRQIFAQERTDSLNRARAAEQQRLQARSDSIRRAQAAQATRDSIAREQQRRTTAAGTSGTAGSTGGAAGSATGTAGAAGAVSGAAGAGAAATSSAPRQPTVEEREAAAREAERLENERRAAEFRRQQEAAREKARQDSILVEQGAQAIVAVGTAVMPMLESFFDGLEGTGLAMGFHAAGSYLPGDAGRMGFGVGYFDPTTLAMWPFIDVSFELGTGEEFALATKGTLLTIGSPIPRVRWNFSKSVLRPHVGVTMLRTIDREDPMAISVERQLLMFGLTWLRPEAGSGLRIDTTLWEGQATFGLGLWMVL